MSSDIQTQRDATWSLPGHIEGRRLAAARTTWLAVCVPTTVFVAVGLTWALGDPRLVEQASLTDVFATLGLDLRLMMVLGLVVPFTTVVLVSAFIFRRRSTDPMALIFTATLLTLYGYSSRSLLVFAETPILRHSISVVFALAMIGLSLTLMLFPDGRIAPRWVRWVPRSMLALLAVFPDAGALMMSLADGLVTRPVRVPILTMAWSIILIVGVVAQVQRYRYLSGATARRQAKWVMAPLGVSVLVFVVVLLPSAIPGTDPAWTGWGIFAIIPIGIVAPLMIANAVLRYRLYDIDRIISRTVSYGLVVAALLSIYVASVLGLSAVAASMSGGERSELVVAASTLVVIAVFRPLRSRVQEMIDRRFNRTTYEGRLAVETFAHRLRGHVDLDTIGRDLVQASVRMLQPRQSTVWVPARADAGADEAPRP